MKLKEIYTKNIICKSNLPIGDYCANPYIGCSHACKYCYACFMKRFTNHEEAWGGFVDIKYWDDIKNKEKYNGKEIFISSVTDPYIPQEKLYKRTRRLLEELSGADAHVSIQTKSDLIIRDIDILKSFKKIRVGFSINTLDESFKKDMDKAVSIERRINAMKRLHEEGIRTTCFISPIFPKITDVFAIIEMVRDKCSYIWLENLNLRATYKHTILEYIKEKYPHLLGLYNDIYLKNNRNYWRDLETQIKIYARDNSLEYYYNYDDFDRDISLDPIIINFFYHEEIKQK